MAYIDKTYIKSYAQYREIADWCKAQGVVIDSFGNKITPYEYIPHIWEYDDELNCIDKGEYTEEYINEWLNNIRKDYGKYKTEEYWMERSERFNNYSTFSSWCEYVDTWAEIPLWNTDHVFDIYLIKNCPIDFIQERLKEQYGCGWSKEAFTNNYDSYEAIKNGTSVYDTYVRNGEKNPHFKINDLGSWRFKDRDISWWIDVVYEDEYLNYDSDADKWYFYNECYMPLGHSMSCCTTINGPLSKRKLYRIIKKWNLPKGTVIKFMGDYNRSVVKYFNVVIK